MWNGLITHKHQPNDHSSEREKPKKKNIAVNETNAWATHVFTAVSPLSRTRMLSYALRTLYSDSDDWIN